ncbi:MAG: type IV pili twitching motility protein PilT [Gammaproteobacteria bacterium HGW-Gammaproteobacteria-5]|jgi:twitching motility protein PilU|nr:PilT/PilU family type 4a pilus ATPase [Xanthomonadaceae bacterium]MDP2186308.1 PilT/PilU family type 4a pilus ATPase [Xanthomonadales bacterium]PKM12639.1 MAG: type IV pili twitching motility protein PilT [Gammaproteobacteria bacterium HGW-Gammaproteobacteria-5]PKM16413.1 MAG: type IV pili twitching motility protein PilT [Gammaproteobacteria bacterium HGW-Gammaproteobacteria-2]MDZ4115809.1 PilT/PilU family type 4a pilus ATPase [Xanthomonadaceae bacterium]
MDIGYFLKLMTEKNASDMFLTTGAPVHIKVEGKLYPLGSTGLPAGMVKKIAYSLMDEGQVPAFERDLEFNMAVAIKDAGRFRINVFKQRGEVGMVIRAINSHIPSIEQLKLPDILKDIVMEARGLVLVVGSTGSGKSTTLAGMINHRNSNTTGHILTIEDPIEFLHQHKKSIVNQREVGLDTHAFHNALKNAMREAPDVILIGEILDATTMEAAIAFAETGHLCLATLHSNNADQTLERILNFFPESAHKNVLMNLSLNLKSVVSQRLVVGKDGKRLPAVEILINTPVIRDMIRRGEVHSIKDAMDKSLQDGMQTFDQSLYRLFKDGKIDLEEALRKADSRDGLALKIRLSEGSKGEHDPYSDVFEGEGGLNSY